LIVFNAGVPIYRDDKAEDGQSASWRMQSLPKAKKADTCICISLFLIGRWSKKARVATDFQKYTLQNESIIL
jgi:hypothetical protein